MSTPILAQLKRAMNVAEQIAALEKELAVILGKNSASLSKPIAARAKGKKSKMSAAARARIGAAQKARWAKLKGKKAPAASKAPEKKKRTMSPEVKAKLAAAMKARWAAAKKSGGPLPTARKK